MSRKHRIAGRLVAGLAAAGTLAAMAVVGVPAASAYTPAPKAMYQMSKSDRCNKGGFDSGCIVYPKSAQLPSGRLVVTFERSIGDPVGETLPVYASDDLGDNWKQISEVKSPHDLEPDNPAYDKYVSNWTNPYLYTLPQDVGDLKAGTLLLASVVTGDDYFYKEHKAADPNWYNGSDGDRADTAIALYSSTDEGRTWKVEGIVGQGGWQGGSARAGGKNIAAANTHKQVDPVWEPYLMVYDGKLICYYSDENDYTGYDAATGVATLRADNDTAQDSGGQVLLHRTWDGTKGAAWSDPVIDVAGKTQTVAGQQEIGSGRPGMTNVVPTTDGKWMITYEDWGGNGSTKYKIADNPLEFYKVGGAQGTNTDSLPVVGGGHVAQGGSPVLVRMPDGSLIYNASGSGNVYVNRSGRSDGEWTMYRTSVGGGYSRNLQYVKGTGRILILHCGFSGSSVEHADVELGYSETPADTIAFANGKVLGTDGGDRDLAALKGVTALGGAESDEAAAKLQQWHVADRGDGTFALVNRSGGRVAAIDGGNKTNVILWFDENADQDDWKIVADENDATVRRIQSVSQPTKYLTIGEDGSVTVQPLSADDKGQRLAAATVDVKADGLADGKLTLKAGASTTLTATVTNALSQSAPVTFTSSDDTIASVETKDAAEAKAAKAKVAKAKTETAGSDGTATLVAHKEGTVTITASAAGASTTFTLTVTKADEPTNPGEPGQPTNPGTPGNTGNTGSTGTNPNGQNANAQNPSASTDKSKPTLSNTGAAVTGIAVVAVALAAAGAAFALKRKRA